MISINFTPAVMKSQNNLIRCSTSLLTALTRMSTGYKINIAKDDAAGYFIANALLTQINNLKVAKDNTNNAISMLSTAESSLKNIQNQLSRARDLAVQASSGIHTTQSRNSMQREVNQIMEEIFQIRDASQFNGLDLFGGG